MVLIQREAWIASIKLLPSIAVGKFLLSIGIFYFLF